MLLLRYEKRGCVFWVTPDGSLESGEDYQIGPQMAERSSNHLVDDQAGRRTERYYVARIDVENIDMMRRGPERGGPPCLSV